MDDEPGATDRHGKGNQFDLIKNQVEILSKKAGYKDTNG